MVQAHSKGAIRSVYFDNVKNYMITSNYDDGVIALIDLQKPGKEKFAHNIASLSGRNKVRRVVWSTSRAEIYSGGEDGAVAFLDAKKAAPICKIYHRNSVILMTKIRRFEGPQ